MRIHIPCLEVRDQTRMPQGPHIVQPNPHPRFHGALPGGSSGGKKRNLAQRRRRGWVSGTSTIMMLNLSGSRICISLNPHGLSVGGSIISTPASSSSCPRTSTSRTCNHRPTLSLASVREEPDNSRKPPPRKKTTPLVNSLLHSR